MDMIRTVNMERTDLSEAVPLEWPFALLIEPSGYCNFRCQFCPQSLAGTKLKKDNMDFSLYKKIVDELSAEHAKIKRVRLSGLGEPLINKDFPMMLEYLAQKEAALSIELLTNGTLLTPKTALVIARFCDIVRISIEGLSEDEYEMAAGKKIDYQQLLDNISCLHAVPERKAKIYIKIHGNSIRNQSDFEKFCNLFGPVADEISVEQLCNSWPGYSSDFIKNEGKFRFSTNDGSHSAPIRHNICPQIFKSLLIFANGDVVPCCFDWERHHTIGNIAEASLKDIWHGEKLKELRLVHLNLMRGVNIHAVYARRMITWKSIIWMLPERKY